MQCDEIKSILLNRQTGIKLGSAVVLTGLISYLKFRPIAILVSSIYVTWIYRTFYSSYHIQIPKELTLKCKTIYENFKELREKRPNVFCGFITSILFLLAVIGQVCNGTYILLACLIAGVFLTSKYEIKIIKENDASIESTPSSGVDVDEFCPQMDEANFMILKQIGDHADDSSIFSVPTLNNSNNNNNNEEIESDSDNELLPKNAIIPEPDEIDLIESEDLLIDPNLVLTQSAEYKRKHFSNTSSESSDSDDSITRGLDFKNIPVTATIEPHTSPSSSAHSLLLNIQQTIARNLIENITSLNIPKSSQTKVYEDDDSDFEILDSEDIPK
ncbi:unnamed protein product [Chironomus riparius]|uniref:Uncharacterized protein n=1 Tax=Chironomus riparius TaxID=315576 RepID=A0A9N9RPL8_9DIPT|nr:unnamed protein product [Chironomus riparius]